MPDTFERYKAGLEELKKRMDKEHPFYNKALSLEAQLVENIGYAEDRGDNETRRSDRNRITAKLNELAMEAVGVSFNDLCIAPASPPGKQPHFWSRLSPRWFAVVGVALALAIVISLILLLPLPSKESPSPTVVATPLRCSTPHPPIDGIDIIGAVTITEPTADCIEVGKDASIEIVWDGVQEGVTMWVLVYSPIARQYYPHKVEQDPLPATGRHSQTVRFEKTEPYDVIVVLADSTASTSFHDAGKAGGIKEAELPGGIEEKRTISVVREP